MDDIRITQSRKTSWRSASAIPRDPAPPADSIARAEPGVVGAAGLEDPAGPAGNPVALADPAGQVYPSALDARLARTRQALPSEAALPPLQGGPASQELPPPPGGHAPLEGFDHRKLVDPEHRTPKYLFARVARQFGLESVKDHASGERLLQQMVPYLRQAGLEIAAVKGDKINVKTELGWEWVDVIRGAGGGNPAWWWGSEGKGSPTPGTGAVAGGGPGTALKPLPGGHAPLEGFDHAKIANPAVRSMKYLFARIAMQTGLESVKDMASAQALLEEMVPHLRAAGMEIAGVKNDKIQVKTEVGWEWVDVIRGAGSGNPAWWWGSEGKGSPVPTSGGAVPAPSNGPAAPNPGSSGPSLPGGPLETVPDNPAWRSVPLDRSSNEAAVKSAAQWVKDHHPEFFDKGEHRPTAYEMMTVVIGILRAHGYDAHRVVNHPSRPIGDPGRYGTDSLVLDNIIFDVYKGWGDAGDSTPQALRVGTYGSRPRE